MKTGLLLCAKLHKYKPVDLIEGTIKPGYLFAPSDGVISWLKNPFSTCKERSNHE